MTHRLDPYTLRAVAMHYAKMRKAALENFEAADTNEKTDSFWRLAELFLNEHRRWESEADRIEKGETK